MKKGQSAAKANEYYQTQRQIVFCEKLEAGSLMKRLCDFGTI